MRKIDFKDIRTNILAGKRVHFELSDGKGVLYFRFGSVYIQITENAGKSHTFKGSVVKLGKLLRDAGHSEDDEFFVEE